jgi:hypothetical protein
METTLRKVREKYQNDYTHRKTIQELEELFREDEAINVRSLLLGHNYKLAYPVWHSLKGYEKERDMFAKWSAQLMLKSFLHCPHYLNLNTVKRSYEKGNATEDELKEAKLKSRASSRKDIAKQNTELLRIIDEIDAREKRE